MTIPPTLADIRTKIRRVTARPSADQITDVEIDNYINTYYLYDMPETLRLLKLKDTFTFITQPNIEVYDFPNTDYMTVEGPAYCGGQQIQYFQDNDLFYREWPKINFIQNVGTGTGANGPYTGTFSATPFLRSKNPTGNNPDGNQGRDINVIISANITSSQATTAIDDGAGGFIDSVTLLPLVGAIDYVTGVFTVTFANPVPAGATINADYIPYVASLPRSMLLYQNQFFLRPIPDQAYITQINAFRFPTKFFSNLPATAQIPELALWWQLIAYGAALKILTDNADFENAENFRPYYTEQLLLVQRQTVKQLSNQRASTIYSNSGNFPYSNLYPYI